MEIPQRPLGKSGVRLPKLGFGGAPLGELFQRIPEAQAQATLQTAWDCGLYYFDTAPWYGHGLSEHRIGHLLRQQVPGSFFCSTKVGRVYSHFQGEAVNHDPAPWSGGLPFTMRFDYSYDGVMRSFEDSLQRLGLNRMQMLVIHDLDYGYHQDEAGVAARFKELESGWKALEALKGSGEILAIGAGINEQAMMPQFLKRFPLDFFLVAMPYTLLDQEVLDSEFPECELRGVGIVVGAPYASGILATGATPDAKYRYAPPSPEVRTRVQRIEQIGQRHSVPLKAAALQFPLGHSQVVSIIPGSLTPEQVRENFEMLSYPIPKDYWLELREENLLRNDAPIPL